MLVGKDATHLLSGQEAAVLRLLLARMGEIVGPLELKRTVWGDAHVSGDVVAMCVARLRERLQPADCIERVYKRGYRISAAVRTNELGAAGALPRLAILPFAVGYGVPEYLAWGIAGETAARLGEAGFGVVAWESVLTLARRELPAHEIGKMLGADFVMSGQLHATPELIRLRAEMIRVADGAELWIDDFLVKRGRMRQLASELVNCVSSRTLLAIGAEGEAYGEPDAEADRDNGEEPGWIAAQAG